jgi:hypothetical protein
MLIGNSRIDFLFLFRMSVAEEMLLGAMSG